MASWFQPRNEHPPHEITARLFALAILIAVIVVVVLTANARGACKPRACKVLQPITQRWICPDLPNGQAFVKRAVCFIFRWPQPTLP